MNRMAPLLAAAALLTAVSVASPQISETEMTEALDRLGAVLGLPPVSPEELKRRVVEIGGLSYRSDVPIDFMSRDDLSRYIRALFDQEYPTEYAESEELMLRGFGFLVEGQDLRTLRERVLHENVAGFYDERPGVKKLFAISSGRNLNVMNQLILAHELRHALQDQHVVLRDRLEVKSDYDDRRLAALCLFEGDASILMQRYMTSGATSGSPDMAGLFQVFSQSLTGEEIAKMFAGPALQQAPAVIQEQLVAPYFEGHKLASAAFARGGFALLNDTLRSPPRSMEQVLHPEKYFDNPEEPVPVSLPEIGNASPSFEGVLGELFIRTLLRAGPAAEAAEAAAAGWGGDLYAVLENGKGDYRLVWRSIWDSENDALEFERAFSAYVAKRFPGETNPVTREGREVFFERIRFR